MRYLIVMKTPEGPTRWISGTYSSALSALTALRKVGPKIISDDGGRGWRWKDESRGVLFEIIEVEDESDQIRFVGI